MRPPLKLLAGFLFCSLSLLAGPKDPERAETLILADNHRVVIAVPAGFVFSSGRDEAGFLMAKLADPKETVTLQVQFQPDPDGKLASEQHQMDFLAQICRQYAEGSVEKSYDFKPLEPHLGTGTYCKFTDASIAGPIIPKGEFLNVTTAVKVWPGWALVFTLLSNNTTSREYQAAFRLMRESFQEIPAAGPRL